MEELDGEVAMDSEAHWQKVWSSKEPDGVSWFEAEAAT